MLHSGTKDTVGVSLQVKEHALTVVMTPSQHHRNDCMADDIHRSCVFDHLCLTVPPSVYSQHLQLGLNKLLLAVELRLHSSYCQSVTCGFKALV